MTNPVERSGADDWETPVRRASSDLVLHFEAFDGPIDFLLEMALRQKIDLGRISVSELADQFQEAVTRLVDEIPIERRADWLIMAARLIQLRARLMFPTSKQEDAEARQEAVAEVRQLLELGHMRAAANWLSDRPQLGIDVFGRPAEKAPMPEGGYVALMEACLFVLEAARSQAPEHVKTYVPKVQTFFWTVPKAIAHVRSILATSSGAMDINAFLPVPSVSGDGILQARAALASTFMAGLELAKAGEVLIAQSAIFGDIDLCTTALG